MSLLFRMYLSFDDIFLRICLVLYCREAERQCASIHRTGPLLVYDSALGNGPDSFPSGSRSLDTHWSQYYRNNKRDPENISDLSPWLLKRLERFSGSRLLLR